MTTAIDLAKHFGIAYYLTPEGTSEMHGTDRQIQAFAEALAVAAIANERERCARLVDEMDNDYLRTSPRRRALKRAAKET